MENLVLFFCVMFLLGIPVITALVIILKAVFTKEHCKGCKCKK